MHARFLQARRLVAALLLVLTAAVPLAAQDEEPEQDNAAAREAAQAAAQEAAERAADTQEKEPERRRPERATRSRNQQSGPSLGEYTVAIDTERRMLRLHPEGRADRQDALVTVGEEFTTDISYDNPSLAPFDQIRVLVSYDTESLEPVAINDAPIAPRLEGEPTAEVDPLFGMILYEATLAEPVLIKDAPILKIRWLAKRVIRETAIEFSNRDDVYTAIVGEGKDLLGNPFQPGDGTLSMTLTIVPEDPREAEAFLNDPVVYAGDGGKVGGIRMYLQPPDKAPRVGQPFHFDLVFDNRVFSNLDSLSALISFDREILHILDADYDNFITRETNIHDGPFHAEFPWTYHIDNNVYQARGLISYRMGTGDPEMTRGKVGTIARIYAVGKRPTEGTPVVFKFNKSSRGMTTEGTFNGRDSLGDPEVFADGTRGVLLRILPERLASAAPAPEGD